MQNDPFNNSGRIQFLRIEGPGGGGRQGLVSRIIALVIAAVAIPLALFSAFFMGLALIVSAAVAIGVGMVASWWMRRKLRRQFGAAQGPGGNAGVKGGRPAEDFLGFSFPRGFSFQVQKGAGAKPPSDDEPIEVEIESRR